MSERTTVKPSVAVAKAETPMPDAVAGCFFPVMILSLWLSEAVSSLWRPLGIGLYIFFLVGVVGFFAVSVAPSVGRPYLSRLVNFSGPLYILLCGLAYLLFLVGGFGGLCRQLYLAFGGFSANSTDYWHWSRLGFSWLLDNVLFNASQIFGWRVSEIQATALWSEVLLFVFNITLEVLAIAAVVRYFQLYRAKRRGEQPVQDGPRRYWLSAIGGTLLLIPAALWIIPTIVYLGAVVEENLSIGTAWSDLLLGFPVVLGGWLVGHALWGLIRVGGLGNKLQALAVMGVGVVLLYATMPTLLAYLQP